MIAIECSERNGKLLAAQLVAPEDEIMLITTGGVLIRTRVSEVREMGRSTQGVRLINLDEGEKLAGLEKIDEPENGDDPAGPAAPAAPTAQ
jgi:DNA gyrase subunit A